MEGLSQLIDADGGGNTGYDGFEPIDPDSDDGPEGLPTPLTRSSAVAGKRPFFPDVESDPSSDDAGAPGRPGPVPLDGGRIAFVIDRGTGPDLDGYFECFGLPVRDRVLLCRSYASYLVAKGQSGIRRPGPKAGFKAPRRV